MNNDFTLVTQHIVMSEHLNPNDTLFGGQLLSWLDSDLVIYACEKAKCKRLVTASMDNVKFKHPGHLGDLIKIYAKICEVRPHYIVINGKAVSHNVETSEQKTIIECDIKVVAVDKNGRLEKKFVPEKSLVDQFLDGTQGILNNFLPKK